MSGKIFRTVQAKTKSTDSEKSSVKSSSIKTQASVKSPAKALGYLRVSTGEQELENNISDILRLANDLDLGKVSFVEENISGKISWRKRKVAEILDELAAGDCLIVSELSAPRGFNARMNGNIIACALKRRQHLLG